jgi:carbon storage regulator
MLILSRKNQEEIVIDGDIIVKVIAIEGKRVRLGIEAKPNVSIVRSELINNQQEGKAA